MNLFHTYIVFFSLVVTNLNAQTVQNLVRNPSFEQYQFIPEELGSIEALSHCFTSNRSTPDYFHSRSNSELVDVPFNRMGNTLARTGLAYTGIYSFTERYLKNDFREYIQLQLKQPMLSGASYCIKAHVFLAQSSNRALKSLGILASRLKFDLAHEHDIKVGHHHSLSATDYGFLEQRDWIEITCLYKAMGGEQYISIGNFLDDKTTEFKAVEPSSDNLSKHVDFAYYYIDDVCVTDVQKNLQCDCGNYDYLSNRMEERIIVDFNVQKQNLKIGQVVILRGLKFEKGTSKLLEGTMQSVDDLLSLLKSQPEYAIELSGHTSDHGDPQKNQILSKKRAEAVYNYLLSAGISSDRMTYRGYGQSRPIALNTSEEGRSKNERVQFLIKQHNQNLNHE